ncbi:MAG: type II toxin-antitoxin system RelE/ParE family toxin [Cyanobacteria bacterium P01_A01_bin.114]
MPSESYEIRIYETTAGKAPFSNWLDSLRDRKAKAKIQIRLERIRMGNFGDCKPVGEGVLELRSRYGPGYRVYFAQIGSVIILLLCGGDKSTQPRDIRQAQQFWADFKRRKNANE